MKLLYVVATVCFAVIVAGIIRFFPLYFFLLRKFLTKSIKYQVNIIFVLGSNQTNADFKHIHAIGNGDLEFINDTDVNSGDDDGRTALMYAAHKGHVNIVKLLIKHGAQVDIKYDKTGATPLDLAIFKSIYNI